MSAFDLIKISVLFIWIYAILVFVHPNLDFSFG